MCWKPELGVSVGRLRKAVSAVTAPVGLVVKWLELTVSSPKWLTPVVRVRRLRVSCSYVVVVLGLLMWQWRVLLSVT